MKGNAKNEQARFRRPNAIASDTFAWQVIHSEGHDFGLKSCLCEVVFGFGGLLAVWVPCHDESCGGHISIHKQCVEGSIKFIYQKDNVAVVEDAIFRLSICLKKRFLQTNLP